MVVSPGFATVLANSSEGNSETVPEKPVTKVARNHLRKHVIPRKEKSGCDLSD